MGFESLILAIALISTIIPILLFLIYYGFFYFKKNITKEKPTVKKFILSSLVIILSYGLLRYLIYSFILSNISTAIFFPVLILVMAPLLIIITMALAFLVLKYFVKAEKTKLIMTAIISSVILNIPQILVFLYSTKNILSTF